MQRANGRINMALGLSFVFAEDPPRCSMAVNGSELAALWRRPGTPPQEEFPPLSAFTSFSSR